METDGELHFFFNDTATTEIYTLSLHDALPICRVVVGIEPVLPHHDGVDGQRAHQADEAAQVVGDLRIAGLVGRGGLADSAHLARVVHLNDVGRDDGLRRAPD